MVVVCLNVNNFKRNRSPAKHAIVAHNYDIWMKGGLLLPSEEQTVSSYEVHKIVFTTA